MYFPHQLPAPERRFFHSRGAEHQLDVCGLERTAPVIEPVKDAYMCSSYIDQIKACCDWRALRIGQIPAGIGSCHRRGGCNCFEGRVKSQADAEVLQYVVARGFEIRNGRGAFLLYVGERAHLLNEPTTREVRIL